MYLFKCWNSLFAIQGNKENVRQDFSPSLTMISLISSQELFLALPTKECLKQRKQLRSYFPSALYRPFLDDMQISIILVSFGQKSVHQINKPGECLLVPLKYQVLDESMLYIFYANDKHVMGMYMSCFYSLMQCDTSHLYIVNVGHRLAKIVKDTVIVIYALVIMNMVYVYLNVIDMYI